MKSLKIYALFSLAYFQSILERLDKWICISLPFPRLRIWWQGRWIRRNEFHPSFHLDHEAIMTLERWGGSEPRVRDIYFGCGMVRPITARYLADVARRRQIAHERSL